MKTRRERAGRQLRPSLKLMVAEKPSVARDLARHLGCNKRLPSAYAGPSLWITWCVGHMAELAPPEHYHSAWRAWSEQRLPMVPKAFALVVNRRNEGHWRELKALLQDRRIASLVNACDAGREGELIFRYVYELAGCQLPVERLWLQAMTKTAIERAFVNLVPSDRYDQLADAARCRAEADWLVGLNATRALTLAGRRTLQAAPLRSVGRVQTPTLAMLVAREEAIERFVPVAYWEVSCRLREMPAVLFRVVAPPPGRLAAPQSEASGQKSELPATASPAAQHRFATATGASRAASAIGGRRGEVKQFAAKEQALPQPLLYDLTALQREANLRFRARAADTLAAAQELYERDKVLTYPRTDSRYLTTDLAGQLPALIKRLAATGPYRALTTKLLAEGLDPAAPRRLGNDREVRDHHAIVPTGTAYVGGASTLAGKIYGLVVRRLLAACAFPAKVASAVLTVRIAQYDCVARGRSVLAPGWLAYDPPARAQDDTAQLPPAKRGTSVSVAEAKTHDLKTKAPPRLSEGTLLLAMERAGTTARAHAVGAGRGLGTPATRAAIIETLKQRGYVQTVGPSLAPTQAGRALIAALPAAALKSAELTSEWENALHRVASGQLARHEFMAQIVRFVISTTECIITPKGGSDTDAS